jgi:hypothetical protein
MKDKSAGQKTFYFRKKHGLNPASGNSLDLLTNPYTLMMEYKL